MTDLRVYQPDDEAFPPPPDDMSDVGKRYWKFAAEMLPQAGIVDTSYGDFHEYVESQVRLTHFLQVAAVDRAFNGRGLLALSRRRAVNEWERWYADDDERIARWMRRQRLAWMKEQIEQYKADYARRN